VDGDLLRQLDDDPGRAAHLAQPLAVLVVHQLAASPPAGRRGCLDVVDDEEDVADIVVNTFGPGRCSWL
jgi:hypothetical protein